MSSLRIARRELASRWPLLALAVVLGATSLAWRRSPAAPPALWLLSEVTAFVVGLTLLGGETTDNRLSFYLTRPVSPAALFAGLLAAGVAVAVLVQLLVYAPASLAWHPDELLEPRSLLEVLGATAVLVAAGFAAAIAARGRGPWFIVDVVGLSALSAFIPFAAKKLEGEWHRILILPSGPGRQQLLVTMQAHDTAVTDVALACAFVAFAAAGAAAIVRGRTDARRAHATMSLALWGIIVPMGAVLWLWI